MVILPLFGWFGWGYGGELRVNPLWGAGDEGFGRWPRDLVLEYLPVLSEIIVGEGSNIDGSSCESGLLEPIIHDEFLVGSIDRVGRPWVTGVRKCV